MVVTDYVIAVTAVATDPKVPLVLGSRSHATFEVGAMPPLKKPAAAKRPAAGKAAKAAVKKKAKAKAKPVEPAKAKAAPKKPGGRPLEEAICANIVLDLIAIRNCIIN